MQTATVTMELPARKAPPAPRNGVDTPALMETIFGVVANQPSLAKFQFRAKNKWLTGTHSRTSMTTFAGAGGEHAHKMEYTADGDHPAVLCGADQGPTPVEWVLHALATCLTAGIANIAAARGVTLHRVESSVEGDIDLQGILGLSKTVRNGYQNIRIKFEIAGDAPPEKLREIVEQSRARSAVYDILTNGVPVAVEVKPSR
ncbi:MAG: OsmC family protein [Alphaproteobacteria bacterium]|nr:OsmC family protein [Alphaproteobacteria bacterium]